MIVDSTERSLKLRASSVGGATDSSTVEINVRTPRRLFFGFLKSQPGAVYEREGRPPVGAMEPTVLELCFEMPEV